MAAWRSSDPQPYMVPKRLEKDSHVCSNDMHEGFGSLWNEVAQRLSRNTSAPNQSRWPKGCGEAASISCEPQSIFRRNHERFSQTQRSLRLQTMDMIYYDIISHIYIIYINWYTVKMKVRMPPKNSKYSSPSVRMRHAHGKKSFS